jgi:carnitine 3-dehydrogenase
VLPDWIDYNGHMTEHRYLQVFGDATDAVLRHVGADAAYVAAGHSYYTAQTSISYRREVREGVAMQVSSQVLGADDKRLHLFHSLNRADDNTLLATAETMLVHVDTKAGGACPALPGVLTAVRRLTTAQTGLPRPPGAGKPITLPPER